MPFSSWVQRGFPAASLIPITPPGAVIAPTSRLRPEVCGKSPGLYGSSGWYSFAWLTLPVGQPAWDNAEKHGCGVGLLAGAFPAVDIDVLDEALAAKIEALALEYLGPSPRRVGRWPKRLLPYAADGSLKKTQLRFSKGTESYLVETLAEGQQYVVEGIHPGTLAPYAWTQHPCADTLTQISEMDVAVFFAMLEAMLAEDGWTFTKTAAPTSSDFEAPLPEQLDAPSLEALQAEVAVWPNTTELYPTRENYIEVAYAIKAAGRQWPDAAEQCWLDWCAKWEGGNDLDVASNDWARCHPPHRVGWGFIQTELLRTGAAPLPDREPTPGVILSAPIARRLPLGFDVAAIAPRQWVLGKRFLAGTVTGGFGAPGTSKSTMSLLSALAIATGREDLTGEKVYRQGAVWVHNNEDDDDELHRRIGGMLKHYNIPVADVRDRLLISSGAVRRLRVAYREQQGVVVDAAVQEIIAQIKAQGVVFMAVDPFVSVHDGIGENDNEDVEKVVMALRSIAQQTNCAMDLVHHTVKNHTGNTEARAGDMNAARGAGALAGAVRAAYTLSPMSDKTIALLGIKPEDGWRYVRMDMAKGNYSPRDKKALWFRLESVPLGNGGDGFGDSVGVPVLDEGISAKFSEALAAEKERDGLSFDDMAAEFLKVLHETQEPGTARMAREILALAKEALGLTRKKALEFLDQLMPLGAETATPYTDATDCTWLFARQKSGANGFLVTMRKGETA